MKSGLLIAALLAAAIPASLTAQAPAPAAASSAADATASTVLAAVDPARLSAAHPVIDRIWPLGTYARIMHGVMDQMMQSVTGSMYDMRAGDLVSASGADAKTADALKGKTMGDIFAQQDPAYKQRMKITMEVMTGEMSRIMTDIEPDVRDAMAHAYARRFTVEQLGDLDRFFATPTGAAYASESMTLMMGPDMMKAMQSFAPRLMKEMPAIMAKVSEATKGLPPLKKVSKP